MNELAIRSFGIAIARGQSHLTLSERQFLPDVKDMLMLTGALTLAAYIWAHVAVGGFVAVGFLPMVILGIIIPCDLRRLVCIVSHGDYFIVLRSFRWRLGRNARWDLVNTPAELIAVLEKDTALRPEERPITTLQYAREIFVFQQGRVNILFSGRMSEDESIEKLHAIRSFLEANGARVATDARATAPETAALYAEPKKGTLQ